MEINKEFLGKLFEQAVENPRLRQSYDLRTSSDDNSQRILNALLPGTVVPIHRHPNSNENVLLLCGKLVEVIYDENGKEKAARQLQKLLYFKRILDDFGETETAQRVRSTCDRWRDYVPNTRLSKKRRHSPKN